MPIPTLNGPFGIGVLGIEAMEFVDFLKNSGFSTWQILPVEHTGSCFSPYKCISAFAGEPMLIDPRGLLEMELITQDELNDRMWEMTESYIDYEQVYDKQWKLLRLAYNRVNRKSYEKFNPFWLNDYTNYMVEKFDESADFFKFVQWLFDIQWKELKKYANDAGILLFGDMPIYVAEESADVWSNPEIFDKTASGGCPPDYFNEDGQKWNNPVYDWKLLKKDGYKWWVNRMKAAIERYDIVRLDHFRGFESYWRIPIEDKDAKGGTWEKGPGNELFKVLRKNLGDLPIVAEDLGVITDDVQKLMQQTGFTGMRVLQFGFHGDDYHLPHNFPENAVVYTGTHDNTTLLAWLFELNNTDRERALFYIGFDGDWTVGGADSPIIKAWIRALYMSPAKMVVVPIQDLLGFGSDTRTNTPGTTENNWKFRILPNAISQIDCEFYARLSREFGRSEVK